MPHSSILAGSSANLRDHAGSLAQLFDCLPNTFLFVKDRKHRFVRCNRALLSLHGLQSEEEMLGKTDADFHPPRLAEAYVAEDQAVMKTSQPVYAAAWLVTTAVSSSWYSSTKLPVFDDRRKVIGVAGILSPHAGTLADLPEYARVRPALVLAKERFASGVKASELAAAVNLSVNQFTRVFRALFKLTPGEYLLRLKLDHATRLLRSGGTSLTEIALESGFYDHSAFTKHFTRRYGVTPSAYRKRFGQPTR